MPDKHAKLSASGSDRWLNCPRSVALEGLLPDTSSTFAEEGTLAHDYAAQLLEAKLKGTKETTKLVKELEKTIAKDMLDYIMDYAEYCIDRLNELKLQDPSAILLVEQRVYYNNVAPDGFGTSDCTIVSKDKLIVIDLKYGKGVKVSADGNSQLRLYAIGAYDEHSFFYPDTIKEVEMVIHQTRLNHITSETITTEELLEWGESNKEKAKVADENRGDFKAGKWCKFCKVKSLCRHRATGMLDVIKALIIGGPKL